MGPDISARVFGGLVGVEHNPQLDAREDFVSPGTENLFQDDFWEGLDFVTNALDNVKARLYVDSRCAGMCGMDGVTWAEGALLWGDNGWMPRGRFLLLLWRTYFCTPPLYSGAAVLMRLFLDLVLPGVT